MPKSSTDLHWNERALSETDDAKVSFHDPVQRDLELDFVFAHLPAAGRVVEVGCGNGYATRQIRERTGHVDAFDFAENMVDRARSTYGETNNRFFHGSLLDRGTCDANAYDAAICVRVLINLRELHEQMVAINNISYWLKPGGKLILIEGFRDGFDALDQLRADCGLPPLMPAAINYYSRLSDLWSEIARSFESVDEFHTGTYDFLTRLVLPRIAGADQSEIWHGFHRKIEKVARHFNPAEMKRLARARGFALVKQS